MIDCHDVCFRWPTRHIRAGLFRLERFGLGSMSIKMYVSCVMFVGRSYEKNCATAVGGGAHHHGRDACHLRGGRRSRCSCVVDRHHDRRGDEGPVYKRFGLVQERNSVAGKSASKIGCISRLEVHSTRVCLGWLLGSSGLLHRHRGRACEVKHSKRSGLSR